MAAKIKIRRGTSVQWAASTLALSQGELGLDTTLNKLKVGNGSLLWADLPFFHVNQTQLTTQAATTLIAANLYTDTAVTSLGNTSAGAYALLSEIGQPDGIATLNADGKLTATEIPANVTINDAVQTLTNKTISLGTGITSASGYDDTSAFFGQNNIPILQDGLDKGGKINISSEGVITVASSGIGYASGIVIIGEGTSVVITVGGNTLNGTLAEFNLALSDGNFATESYVATAVSNLVDAAPETLNTLNELAASINDDSSFAATVSTALGGKLNTTTAVSDYLTINNAAGTYLTTASATSIYLEKTQPALDYQIFAANGAYIVNGVPNGPITLTPGKPSRISVQASGHPFWFQTSYGAYNSADVYTTGIENSGTATGQIVILLPSSAPQLYYACEFHSSMKGIVLFEKTSNLSVSVVKTESYTPVLKDMGEIIEMSGGGTFTITDSEILPVGTVFEVLQTGTSQVTIAGNGFTPNATPGLKLRTQWSSATVIKRALNSWVVLGDLSA